jgi:hypothetical protein
MLCIYVCMYIRTYLLSIGELLLLRKRRGVFCPQELFDERVLWLVVDIEHASSRDSSLLVWPVLINIFLK